MALILVANMYIYTINICIYICIIYVLVRLSEMHSTSEYIHSYHNYEKKSPVLVFHVFL